MKRAGLAAAVALLAGSGLLLDFRLPMESTLPTTTAVGVGQVANVIGAYGRWKARLDQAAADRQLEVTLGYWKGLSTEFTKAGGRFRLDVERGIASAEVAGLPTGQAYEVWLVDSPPSNGAGAAGQRLRLGSLTRQGGPARLEASVAASVAAAVPAGFEMDLVVITRAGARPEGGGVLYGSPNLFQRLYYAERRGLIRSASAKPATASPFDFMIPRPAHAAEPGMSLEALLADLVSDGEKLFLGLPPFEDAAQFAGNGRTCGTCHPAENNFTIDPAFIATLPADDPLFVAELNPNLQGLEKPELMRRFGLILENVDGFEDPENKFVMRSVPHVFALATSITPPAGFSHASSTGWSGDGAPLDATDRTQDGSLRAFAVGAVKQHFTQTLNRVDGTDFRLPTEAELDALEAFQLSLGRGEDPSLFSTFFKTEPLVATGRLLFLQQGQCIFCHFNAGANDIIFGVNGNRNTRIENLTDVPARLFDPTMPRDGGFGTLPDGSGGYGDGTFNPPPLIEAADSAPFFHNNARATLEDAIRFYNTNTFNNSPGAKSLGVSINLQDPQDIDAIGAFLRAINATENIRNSIALDNQVRNNDLLTVSLEEGRRVMSISRADTADAEQVLKDGPHNLYADAQTNLRKSIKQLDQAIAAVTAEDRTLHLQKAIRQKKTARGLIVVE